MSDKILHSELYESLFRQLGNHEAAALLYQSEIHVAIAGQLETSLQALTDKLNEIVFRLDAVEKYCQQAQKATVKAR